MIILVDDEKKALMLEQVYIAEMGKYVGENVTLKGWVYNRRSSGNIRFLMLRDGTGIAQGVISKADVSEQTFELADRIPQESSAVVKGKIREDKRAPGGYEILVSELEPIQIAENYPITKKEHGTGFLMSHRHLWLRSKKQQAIMRIRNVIISACRKFFDSLGFLLVDAPILTPSAVEGTTTLFETDYFGETAYLSQSGQLYMEAAAMAFGKVYCFGPTFRAEKSKTRRHITEFWQIEPEIAFAELDDIMELAEKFVAYITEQVLVNRAEELKILERDTGPLENVIPPFPRISYDEAVDILNKEGSSFKWGDDFGSPEETLLSEKFNKPLLVHHYPAKCKPFYMKRDPQNPQLALAIDMLAPEGYGEIIGGSQREDDLETIKKRIEEHNLPQDAYEWYLDLRKYGSVPHSGFGLGLERTITWICKLPHIREAIPFPRLLEKCYP